MSIVARGLGIEGISGSVPDEGTFLISLVAEPEIIVEAEDVVIEVEANDVDITLEKDITIEVD